MKLMVVENKDWHKNHRTFMIYCNVTNELIYKMIYGKEKYKAGLHFLTTKRGNNLLMAIEHLHGKKTVINEVKEHARRNLDFVKLNG